MTTAEGGPGRSIGPQSAGVPATSSRGVRGIKGHKTEGPNNNATNPRVMFICSVFSPPRSFLPTHAVDCSYTGRTQMKKETHRRRSSPPGLAQVAGEERNNKYTTTLGGQEQQQQHSGAYAPLIATPSPIGRLLVMVVVVDALLLLLRVPLSAATSRRLLSRIRAGRHPINRRLATLMSGRLPVRHAVYSIEIIPTPSRLLSRVVSTVKALLVAQPIDTSPLHRDRAFSGERRQPRRGSR